MVAPEVDFHLQYNASYITRLMDMRELILGNPSISEYDLPVRKLKDIISDECIVIAILFVTSSLKFSILKAQNRTDVSTDTYFNEDAVIHIEDDTGKIEIEFTEEFDKLTALATGMVLGFVGSKNEKNVFICSDVIFPKRLERSNSSEAGGKILVLSNIFMNNANYEGVRVIVDFYRNEVQDVIIFGNFLDNTTPEPDFDVFNRLLSGIRARIHLIPGFNDPTPRMIPQYPLHRLLLSKSHTNINLLQNPCEAIISDRNVVLINGFIVQDILKYVTRRRMQHEDHMLKDEDTLNRPTEPNNILNYTINEIHGTENHPRIPSDNDTLDVLVQLLQIRHMAPSAPDTISCFPFTHRDPFIINKCEYLMMGGSESLSEREYMGIKVICVPDFNLTQSAVLIDTADKSTLEIRYRKK